MRANYFDIILYKLNFMKRKMKKLRRYSFNAFLGALGIQEFYKDLANNIYHIFEKEKSLLFTMLLSKP